MMNDFYYTNFGNEPDEPYPDFFFEWDDAVSSGKKPGFYEPEELTEIIEIYIVNNQIKRAGQAINYALRVYSDDEELIYEILLLLNDYERWNDLLEICKKYGDESDVWMDGHYLTALLHLGAEEESFALFNKLKSKYAHEEEDLSIVYQAMGEALCEVDLYDSSIAVIQKAIHTLTEDINFYWLQLQCYVSLNRKEEVIESAKLIQRLTPLDADMWRRLGLCFREVDDREKAIDAFENARSLGHNPEEVLVDLVFVYEKNKNFKKALENAKEYLILFPDSFLMNLTAAKLNSRMKRWSDAVKFINIALALMPELEPLYLYKSNYLLHLNEYGQAKSVLAEGLDNTKDTEGYLSKKLLKLNRKYPD